MPRITVATADDLSDKAVLRSYTQRHARDLIGKRAVITDVITNGAVRIYEIDHRPVGSDHGRHEALLRPTTKAVTVAAPDEPAPPPAKRESRRGGAGKTRGEYKTVKPKRKED